MKKKKKSKWSKVVCLREATPRDDDILDEGDFVMDGYSIQIPSGQSKVNIDDLTIDQDDYELQQEEATDGLESDDAEPIAVDRYFRRIR